MAKKKEVEAPKVEVTEVNIPTTPTVKIVLLADGLTYEVSNDMAKLLIGVKRAKLA
jgi:hypothetical protein